MARHEDDREDLIAEAKAFVMRAELAVPPEIEPILLGLRSNGWFSVYWNANRVFHFDEQGGLRRAFLEGSLYRSGTSGLARLVRNRRGIGASELLRSDLTAAELAVFFADMQQSLEFVAHQLAAGEATVLRQVPEEGDVVQDLRKALTKTLPPRLAGPVGRR
jgi:hypothetical protein